MLLVDVECFRGLIGERLTNDSSFFQVLDSLCYPRLGLCVRLRLRSACIVKTFSRGFYVSASLIESISQPSFPRGLQYRDQRKIGS